MSDDKKKDDYTIEMGDRSGDRFEPPKPAFNPPALKTSSIMNHPLMPVFSYCASSIMMTVLNKYVLSPTFNLNFLLICVQVRRFPFHTMCAPAKQLPGLCLRNDYPHSKNHGRNHLPRLQLR